MDKIDEQIIIGTPYSIIINGFPAHNLKATDLSYHKKNCQIVKVLQEEQPEIPVMPSVLPSEAEAISDLKRIVAMRIGHLTRQANLTPVLNNQLTSLIDLQRKLLESPAEDKQKNEVSAELLAEAIRQSGTKIDPLLERVLDWAIIHQRLETKYGEGVISQRFLKPWDEGFGKLPGTRICTDPSCPICLSRRLELHPN